MAGARRDELERRTRHQPEAVEARLFERWERECGFSGDPESDAETYVIPLPPPNVTGELHMGHALNGSIQDTLIRLHRMRGRNTLWICGTDHASIAVHAVIEKQLRAEGTNRIDVGREAFIQRVWEWRRATGATIIQQLKRLGCTLDYEHERFTMDEGYVRAVMETFVRLYDKGLIYRDNRIVNWCPGCGSTVSDLEVRHEHAADALYEVRYPITGTDQFLTVATVRPETILADTAVAVHPDDDRYRHLVGKTAIVPIVGREVPIIADDYVKMDFGTGALKVTPGHDPNDFEIGRRHGLPEISVIGFDGRMSAEAGEFAGLAVGEARQKVIDRLFSEQLLHGERPYEHEVGHCDRTGDRIEPLISLQWFMQMDSLAAGANAEVRSGRVRFVPRNQEAIYFHWMDNIRPWCISRQLWWGHQIPVWYCPDGHRTVSVQPPAACGECGSTQLERDPDVLDTWFSSALWPFATLGWPEATPEVERYYPGDVNVTAREIIRLWENRMIFSGLFLLGEIPFSDVIITSTVMALDGRRMSKSLGTGIDPLEAVRKHGADATRYGLLKLSSAQDPRFSWGNIEEGAKLANKLWNVARLILTAGGDAAPRIEPQTLEERWILKRIDETRAHIEEVLPAPQFEFAQVVNALYHLVFDDFCDWYAEAIKPRLYAGDEAAVATSRGALERLLALLHPVMPHVTEEIWSQFHGERLIVSAWPELDATAGDARALDEVQRAAVTFRRSGVLVPLEGEEKRIFDAVVKPERVSANGDAEAERERLRKEIVRSEGMLANDRFVSKAPAELVEAEREKLARFRRDLEALGA